MTYISSQHYIDEIRVEEKMENIKDATEVVIPCYYVGEIDGEEYAMQADCHHTLAAARALGLNVIFDVKKDPEGLSGEAMLDARWMDGDWYDVEKSDPMNNQFALIW